MRALRAVRLAAVASSALLISLLVGIEAGTLRRFTLARRGWKNVGVVSGYDLEDAERRFFAAWDHAAPSGAPRTAAAAAATRRRRCRDVARHYRAFPRTGAQPVSVAIVDYGSGNLHSAAKAFERAAREMPACDSRSW